MTTAASASDLQFQILTYLRDQYPDQASDLGVEITPVGDDGAWYARLYSLNGARLSPNFERAKISVQQRLRGEFHLESVD
jgi:hypothetical protein